jgi:hypothetical protein
MAGAHNTRAERQAGLLSGLGRDDLFPRPLPGRDGRQDGPAMAVATALAFLTSVVLWWRQTPHRCSNSNGGKSTSRQIVTRAESQFIAFRGALGVEAYRHRQ